MAHGTAALNHITRLGEMGVADELLLHRRKRGGLLFLLAGQHFRHGGKPHDDDEDEGGQQPGPCGFSLAGMGGVEPVADGDAHQEDECCDDPVELRGESQRIMVRQHEEDDGQRQVVVVQRALLGDAAVFRVRRAPGDQIGNHDLLVGNDDEEHIRRHDGGGKRTEMQEGGAARENLSITPRHRHQRDIEHDHQAPGIVAERRFAEEIVKQPADGKRGKRQTDGLELGERQHGMVDEEKIGATVINDAEHGEAGKPGDVAFPFEPCQVLGHLGGGDQIFLDVIETAAMYLPFLAIGPRRQMRPFDQPEIERDEIKG
ncbi:hypothetical protein D3C80_1226700 [compost metagenome]